MTLRKIKGKMRKIVFSVFIITLVFLAVSGIVMAQETSRNPAAVTPSGKTVIIPDQAKDNSPVLERAFFIHYRKNFAKPGVECGNGVCEAGENARKCPADCGVSEKEKGLKCYGFLSRGTKLRSQEDLNIHPNLDLNVIRNSALEWDNYTSPSLFGNFVTDTNANWDNEIPDGKNEFSYGNYPQTGVIGVTVAWGYFSGPPSLRSIEEFDVLFDTDYAWGDATLNPNVMDLQNIATHEIGHGVGLGDIYDGSCAGATMYGYSDFGEIQKRDLAPADITGISELYN